MNQWFMIVWFNKTKKTQSFMIIFRSQLQMWDELDVITIFLQQKPRFRPSQIAIFKHEISCTQKSF